MKDSLGQARRARAIKPFLVMDTLREANALEAGGKDIVHMEAGQPSGPPPRAVVEAAHTALETNKIGYTESQGLPALRARIARYYRKFHGVDIGIDRIVITTGSSGGFILAFLACFDHGARVALALPGYPAYRNILTALGIEVVDIETSAANRWVPTPGDVARLADEGPVDGLLFASPANPNGTMATPEALRGLACACAKHGIRFISDEIYHRLNYTMDIATAVTANPDAVIINSFSKYYCMTGWRIGWMVVPRHLARTCEVMAQSLFISAPTLSQIAAMSAFDATEELEQRKAGYMENRALLLDALPSLGIDGFMPVDGAFYIYADVGRFTNDSQAFAHKMLREAGVAVTPGADFDAARGQRYVRLSFAGARGEIESAIKRLKAWL